MSGRPGTVRAELETDLPRTGSRTETVTSPPFVALRQRALEALS
jgi:hypothetical protein